MLYLKAKYAREMSKILRTHAANIDYRLCHPHLTTLIWEATRSCNFACRHCCIPRGDWKKEKELTTEQAKGIFYAIAQDFDPRQIHIAITGGEATLRNDLVEMVKFLVDLCFAHVGVDSNGFNYAKDITLLDRLFDAGMSCPTIGVDGLREGYKKTRGIDCFDKIIDVLTYVTSNYSDKYISTFTVVNNYNKKEIPALFDLLAAIGIKYARLALVMPIGRASSIDKKIYKLPTKDLHALFEWIGKKRKEFNEKKFPMEIELSEDGWCGLKYEYLTKPKKNLFFCETGLTTATILYDGKIGACPHLPRNLTIQGDALRQRFKDVWEKEFRLFRNRDWLKIGECAGCSQWEYCRGGPMHYRDISGSMKKCLYDEVKAIKKLRDRAKKRK
jgi:radical SAM protein with 4Fe4S-binding SPASM domain